MNTFHSTVFTLYVTKDNRGVAVSNLAAALSHHCFCPYKIQIVDFDGNRQLAEEEHITCTPTLVCEGPGPRTTLVGDFSALGEVRDFLHRH